MKKEDKVTKETMRMIIEEEKEQLLERLRISETDRFYDKPNTRENRR